MTTNGMQSARVPMALWKKFWILFTVIWVFVALLDALTTLAFAEEIPPDRVLTLLAVAVVVPAALYAVGWLRDWLRRRPPPRAP
jgi:uncharacterized membrane protein YbhN (UPF0104 family)